MSDYKFEKIIIAYTAGELLEKLEEIADETVIRSEGGLWAGTGNFIAKTETFTDAFDHTDYKHVIYEPANDSGEICFMLRKQETEPAGYILVATAVELKQYLKENVPSECKAISVDNNFELGGAITENIKLMLLRKESELFLDF